MYAVGAERQERVELGAVKGGFLPELCTSTCVHAGHDKVGVDAGILVFEIMRSRTGVSERRRPKPQRPSP